MGRAFNTQQLLSPGDMAPSVFGFDQYKHLREKWMPEESRCVFTQFINGRGDIFL